MSDEAADGCLWAVVGVWLVSALVLLAALGGVAWAVYELVTWVTSK